MKATYIVYVIDLDGNGIEYLFDDKVKAEKFAKKHGRKVEIKNG